MASSFDNTHATFNLLTLSESIVSTALGLRVNRVDVAIHHWVIMFHRMDSVTSPLQNASTHYFKKLFVSKNKTS